MTASTQSVSVLIFIASKDILAIDDHPVFLAQVCFELRDCLVEAFVQLLGGIEHRGIRELKTCHYSLLMGI
jgi:hypothetical protein